MEEMTKPPILRVTPSVVGTVECENCRTGYVPTPEQAAVLFGIPSLAEWTSTATEYAIDAGWYERENGDLLCAKHAELGDGDLPPRMGWLELCGRYPKRDNPPLGS